MDAISQGTGEMGHIGGGLGSTVDCDQYFKRKCGQKYKDLKVHFQKMTDRMLNKKFVIMTAF